MPLSFSYFVFYFLFSEVQFVFVLISIPLRVFGDLWPVCVCNGGLGQLLQLAADDLTCFLW